MRSNFEFVVSDVLAARFETFLPFYLRPHRMRGLLRSRRRPLFPGYVFVRVAPSALRTEAMRTRGVWGVISLGREAEPIPAEIVADLQRAAANPAAIAPAAFEWYAGEPVTIARGSFAGLTGVIARQGGVRRLVITVGFLGRACAVEIGEDEIFRASCGSSLHKRAAA